MIRMKVYYLQFSLDKRRQEISNFLIANIDNKLLPNVIGPNVSLKYVKIGIGNIIYNNAYLATGVAIGNFNIIYYGSILGHEAFIKDCNLLAANTTIGGRVKLGSRIEIGNHSAISLNVTLADDLFVGVGSVVTSSIFKLKRVFSNPAKSITKI